MNGAPKWIAKRISPLDDNLALRITCKAVVRANYHLLGDGKVYEAQLPTEIDISSRSKVARRRVPAWNIIGRSIERADIAIDHNALSRTHLVVAIRDDPEFSIAIIDLKSKRGTFVNEEKIQPSIPYVFTFHKNRRCIISIGKSDLRIEVFRRRDEIKEFPKSSVKKENFSISKLNGLASVYGHTKSVSSIVVDKSGTVMASGGYDYSVKLYDFAGMASRNKSADIITSREKATFTSSNYKNLMPENGKQIVSLDLSQNGGRLLVAPATSQAKLYSRTGKIILTTARGDPYLRQMSKTRGHTATLSGAKFHPTENASFLTSAQDGTVRLWDVNGPRTRLDNHLISTRLMQPRGDRGERIKLTSMTINEEGLIGVGCGNESLQFFDTKSNTSIRPDQSIDLKKICSGKGFAIRDITGIDMFRSQVAVRVMSGFLVFLDIRNPKDIVFVVRAPIDWSDTGVQFSPDGGFVATGTSASIENSHGGLLIVDHKRKLTNYPEQYKSLSVVSLFWHRILNQLYLGCADSSIQVAYETDAEEYGILRSINKSLSKAGITRKKADYVTNATFKVMDKDIYYPNALPMYQNLVKNDDNELEISEKPMKITENVEKPDKPPTYLTEYYNPNKKAKTEGADKIIDRVGQSFIDSYHQTIKPDVNIVHQDPRKELTKYASTAKSFGYSMVEGKYTSASAKSILANKTLEQEEEEAKQLSEDLKAYQDNEHKRKTDSA